MAAVSWTLEQNLVGPIETEGDHVEKIGGVYAIQVKSVSPTNADQIVIQTAAAGGKNVIIPITISGTDPYDSGQIVVAWYFDEIHLVTNTGNRADVYIWRAHERFRAPHYS